MTAKKKTTLEGMNFLDEIKEKLTKKIAQMNEEITAGRKTSRVCMNITGKIIQRWTSMATKIMIISRLFFSVSMRIRILCV